MLVSAQEVALDRVRVDQEPDRNQLVDVEGVVDLDAVLLVAEHQVLLLLEAHVADVLGDAQVGVHVQGVLGLATQSQLVDIPELVRQDTGGLALGAGKQIQHLYLLQECLGHCWLDCLALGYRFESLLGVDRDSLVVVQGDQSAVLAAGGQVRVLLAHQGARKQLKLQLRVQD